MAVPKLDPGTALNNAAQAYAKGEFDAAERACRTLIQRWPDFGDAMHLLAVILHQRNDNTGAATWLTRLIHKQPGNPQVHNTLGSVYKAQGKLIDAALMFAKAQQLAPDYLDPYINLSLIFIDQGKPHDARPLLEQVLKKNPQHARAHSLLGDVFTFLKDYAPAIKSYQAALQLAPEQITIRFALALAHRHNGDYAHAEQRFKQVIAANPKHLDALIEFGNTLLAQKKHTEAIECYQALLREHNNHPGALNNLAALYEDTEQLDLAEHYYRHALTANPNDTDATANLGRLLCNQGRLAEAEPICQRGIALAPNSVNAHINLAYCFYLARDYQRAEPCYQRVLDIDPNNSRANYNLGNICVKTGQFAKSIRYFERALELAPDHKDAAFNLGISHLTMGNYAEGFHYYFQRPRIVVERDTLSPFSPTMPLAGKHILLTKAQGIGDEIFYLRFAPLLAAKGAILSYRPDPKITSFVHDTPCISTVLDLEQIAATDYTFAIDDLPLLLQIRDASEIPPPLPLNAQPSLVDAWRATLADIGPPPYIAVTWRAGTVAKSLQQSFNQLYKAIDIAHLGASLRDTRATILVLQRHPAAGEIDAFSQALGRTAYDLSHVNDNLDDMLALLDVIDDYVGVSNTNMHLRAGLAKPAHILVPHPADWRWLLSGEISPWFPHFKVYREIYGNGWEEPLCKLRHTLAHYQ